MALPTRELPKYFVEGWGKEWYVMSRNWRSVAKCPSKAFATKIAKLLIEAENRTEDAIIAQRVRSCRHVDIECVEHVRLDGHDHYLAFSLLEELVP